MIRQYRKTRGFAHWLWQLASLATVLLFDAGFGAAPASAAVLQIPATHPRLWFGDTPAGQARRTQSLALLNTRPLQGNDPFTRALRGVLTGNTADCNAAVNYLVDWTGTPGSGGFRDAIRGEGETLILIYDWCHAQISPANRNTLITRWNDYIASDNADTFANMGSEANNYWWGRTRNTLLWGIATAGENGAVGTPDDRAQRFIDHALDTRMGNWFATWYGQFGVGGGFVEGTDYGVVMLSYPIIAFASAADYGYDMYAQTPFFREAIYALRYGTTPGPTTTPGGSTAGKPALFPFNDDEHFFEGGVIAARQYVGDFAAFMGQRNPGTGNARHAREWLANTNAGRGWLFDAIRSQAPGDLDNLPLDYYQAGAQTFDMRASDDSNAMQVHLQLGTPGGTQHSHLDAGSFQVWRRGRWISRESVGYSNQITGFRGNGTASSESAVAHNTLLFEGRSTGRWIGSGPRVMPPGPRLDNPNGLPEVIRLQNSRDFAFLAADYTRAYRNTDGRRVDWPYADRFVREYIFVRALNALVIVDRMRGSSDSSLPFYRSGNWVNSEQSGAPIRVVAAADVRRTFLMHFESPPTVSGNRVSAQAGPQRADLISLLPANPTIRVIDERRPPPNTLAGQYRVEIDSTGTAESYFIHVIHGGESSCEFSARLIDTGVGPWTVRLSNVVAEADVTIERGMQSTGGSVTLDGGAAQPLRANVQQMSVGPDGPVWEAAPAPPPFASGDRVVTNGFETPCGS